jgi:uroporphyrinogen III methyltransferase/synthase
LKRAVPVIVTRPARQAALLAAALEAEGFSVLELPMQQIVPIGDSVALRRAFANLTRYRLAVFVSPNAIEEALVHLAGPWPTAVPIAVLGPGSRDALAAHGIAAPAYRVICPAAPAANTGQYLDSERLYRMLDVPALKGGTVLIVKGNGGREWLANQLRAAGVDVDALEAYERRAAPAVPAAQALLKTWIDAAQKAQIVVTNSEALAQLVRCLDELGTGARDWLLMQRLLVPHPRIAQNATELGFTRVDLVALDDAGLVEALK